ncbi:interferon-induced very large GTPase 1-like isoform X2 [Hemicordylus capensis]|uniref:interferon-induced very large GTPase 1-like isoform X2 n=1 Tax=Hemicordylus capensis TaxID=884348 RepID=UPI00230315D1|nr:interferon-induced very large GTPase 1-like isoform X2 [Hemicordylus capensis]
MASAEKPSDVIRKARKKLTEALQRDPELIFTVARSQQLLTEGEFSSLSQIHEPQEFLENFIDTVLRKEESTHERFLEFLENLRHVLPSLRPISEYLEDEAKSSPFKVTFRVTLSNNRNTAGSKPARDRPYSEDAKENLEREGSSGAATGSSDSDTLSSHEMISKGKKWLTEILKKDLELIIEELISQSVIEKEQCELLVKLEEDSKTKVQILLLQIQQGGETTCHKFLECLNVACPGSYQNLQRSLYDQDQNPGQSFGHLELQSESTPAAKSSSVCTTESFARPQNTGLTPVSSREKKEENPSRGMSSGTTTKGLWDSSRMSGNEIIQKGRKQLTEIIQEDLEIVLDELLSQSVITEEEYANLNKTEEDSKKKSQKLLLLIQKKGERACCWFLDCIEIACSGSKQSLQPLLNGQDQNPGQSFGHLELQSESTPDRSKSLQNVLAKLNLQKYINKELTLREVLEISSESLKERTPQSLGDLPWHFLRNVFALNVTARNTRLGKGTPNDQGMRGKEEEEIFDEGIFFTSEMDDEVSVNPLDVLCAVLISSDSFLQQEIFSKMSLCQFALPLLLPPLETPKCTLMLWAMRDIVRKWRPHSLIEKRSFREESLVRTSMPTISFVRMGSCSLSKSKLLNLFLSPSQQHYDFFIHRDMDISNSLREIANGLVEMAWYFPGGQKSSDLFSEPVAIANLCGSVESHWLQFLFLTQVSSAVFIFTECFGEKEYALLSSLNKSLSRCYFILERHSKKFTETSHFISELATAFKLKNSQILMKGDRINEAQFVKNLQSIVERIILSSSKSMSVLKMADVAREFKIQVDEDAQECQHALRYANEITQGIKDIVIYKKETLVLQGDLWKNLARVEKELCRMKSQGDTPSEQYKSILKGRRVELHKQQNECDLTPGLIKFIGGITHLNSAEKQYFLKWMKLHLDWIARGNSTNLRAKYKERCKTLGDKGQKTAELDQLISSSSLGVEHFMRELGQFYEAEHSMVREGRIAKSRRQFVHFPSIAVDLMLDGFPLELIDGDASNIPLQWITDVLTELNHKVGGRSKMVVITVLGVQSTGKSTLLNTMFGLQFAVSSGRCTRGAFMMLLQVKGNLVQEFGCDFILVIDTEGLKAPELAKLGDSDQHDNELGTLVIGLSDITIVNMAMENATEMKDILQIVTHAFLRMKEIGQKRNCQFVHQNVSDVCAHDQNMSDRNRLLEQLNEMTQAAAKMENTKKNIKFSDIMDYDPEIHNWYIPGLWHGVPPMAPVNRGYSEKVFELKKYLFEYIKHLSRERPLKDIPQFIEWVKSLWNAVKHENFIFSFRNSLIAEAYTNLSTSYSEWEWAFRKEMHVWVSEQETVIQNVSLDALDLSTLKCELQKKLSIEEERISKNLRQYFESGAGNVYLVEKYKEDFVKSANSLKSELEGSSYSKLEDARRIKKGRYKTDIILSRYVKTIEEKVDGLLDECRKNKCRLENCKLKEEFERMWTKTFLELTPMHLQKRQVCSNVESHLRKDLSSRGRLFNEKLQKGLLSYRIKAFKIKDEYIHLSWFKNVFKKNKKLYQVDELAKSLIDKCSRYFDEKANSMEDYDETYCVELLHMINKELQENNVEKLCTTPGFEVDLKLHILGEAAHAFQKMHEDFMKENDPLLRLEKLKLQYFSVFRDLYLEKDAEQSRAKDFCDKCLHPALVDYINKRLGIEIVENFIRNAQSTEFACRSFFQFTVLQELLEGMNFGQYVKYILTYEEFVKSWIWTRMLDRYEKNNDLENLEKEILSVIINKIRETLEKPKQKDAGAIPEFLDNFCKAMQKDLVISEDNLVGIQFKNELVPKQFSAYIKNVLPGLEKQILSELKLMDVKFTFTKLPVKPQDEIFKRVFGCGKQCPFCKVPCEAGGKAHQEHFAAVHRPQGLGRYRWDKTKELYYSLCSSDVVSDNWFKNRHTDKKWHPYKNYRDYYPDWNIQPDPSINASDYWKFIFAEFNHDFARKYCAKPAELPEDWKKITKEQAKEALKETYNMK